MEPEAGLRRGLPSTNLCSWESAENLAPHPDSLRADAVLVYTCHSPKDFFFFLTHEPTGVSVLQSLLRPRCVILENLLVGLICVRHKDVK